MKKITLDREARQRLARQLAETHGTPVQVGDAASGPEGWGGTR
ncbi:hypothetical protein [Novosphingobium lindaniclasticum]|nr:hypothetical protein [Novosphingobium lindaniclasticum]